MTDTDNVIHVAENKLQQLIRKNRSCIRKPKQRVVRKDSPQPHRPRMQYSLAAKATQTGMPVDNLNLFANDDISEYGEEREERRHGRLAVDDEEGYMVHFQAVCQIPHSCSTRIGVGDDDNLVAPVDELLRICSAPLLVVNNPLPTDRGHLVDVTLDPSCLR